MNQDELVSHATSIALGLGSYWLGAHGVSAADAQTLIGAIITVGAGGYKLYSHWNMVKVPESTAPKVVIGK